MLDEKDLQAIGQLMDRKLEPVCQRLDKLEGRMDKLEGRMDKLEGRMDKLEEEVKALRKDTKQLEKRMNARFDYLEASIEKVDRRLAYNTELLKQTDREILRDMAALA